MRVFSLVLVIILLPSIVSAQTSTPTPTATATPSPSEDSQKVAVLEAQLQTMKDYHEGLLDTVYWSLGALATVVVLIIGARLVYQL